MYASMQCCQGMDCQTDYALAFAQWAKIELLKEKVKERMEKKYGKQLDTVADLLVDVASAREERRADVEKKEEAFEHSLREL